jgi:type II secretory pathway component PulJ
VRRQRGFHLLELMIVTCVTAAVGGAALAVMDGAAGAERLSAAYVEDLRGLRRAAGLLEEDLRAGRAPGEVRYTLERDVLCRDGVPLARNVRAFSLESRGDLAHVRLALGPRSGEALRRDAALELTVRRRPGGAR